MKQLLIFDWDGTLSDSIPKIIECKQELARKYKLSIPDANVIRSVIGKDFKAAMSICFPNISTELFTELCDEFHRLMQTAKYQAALFSNTKEILMRLKSCNYKLAIATSKFSEELFFVLKSQKLEGVFDKICCADEYTSKPDPLMLNIILDILQTAKEQAIMIGDATVDVLFAKNAGIQVAAITSGAATREQLEAVSPDFIFSSLLEFEAKLSEF